MGKNPDVMAINLANERRWRFNKPILRIQMLKIERDPPRNFNALRRRCTSKPHTAFASNVAANACRRQVTHVHFPLRPLLSTDTVDVCLFQF